MSNQHLHKPNVNRKRVDCSTQSLKNTLIIIFHALSMRQVLLWDISQAGAVILHPVRVILMPVHHRYPSEALLLSVSFNSDGSRLAVTSKDRRVRVLDPRAGKILQVLESEECLFLCLSSWGSCSADVSASAGVQLEVPPRQQGFVHQRVEDAPVHREFLMEAQTDGPLGCSKTPSSIYSTSTVSCVRTTQPSDHGV